jgi:2-aminoadipate transaminase
MYSLSPDRVIHLGSFSKIFAPGFRLGWAIAHPEILDKIYVCKQSLDLCPPIFDQYVAAEFLSSGRLDANLLKSIELYKSKRDLLLSLLDEYMPEGVSWTHPEGGLFLFLTMPEGFDSVKFYDTALAAGVAYVAGEFFHPDRSGKNTMRLNFSFMSPERMKEGLILLAELLSAAV